MDMLTEGGTTNEAALHGLPARMIAFRQVCSNVPPFHSAYKYTYMCIHTLQAAFWWVLTAATLLQALSTMGSAGRLPPHLLFSDRDFDENDYEALLALDEGVESRKGEHDMLDNILKYDLQRN